MKIPVALPSAEGKRFDVVGFGECSVDLMAVVDGFPVPDSKQPLQAFEPLVGGQAATAMVACARQGWRTRFVGGVGEDDFGSQIVTGLEHEGVHTTIKRVPRAATRYALILVDRQTGQRTVLERRDPSATLAPTDVDRQVVTSGRVLLVDGSTPELAASAVRWARAEGIATIVDVDLVQPGVDQLLRHVDVLVAAREFPSALTGLADLGHALRTLARTFGSRIVVATLGSEGSLALCQGQEIRTPAYRVRAVDTTGAGDAFRGGFISAWLEAGEAAELATVLEHANATAALKCLSPGAQGGLPTREQVHALVTGAGRVRSN